MTSARRSICVQYGERNVTGFLSGLRANTVSRRRRRNVRTSRLRSLLVSGCHNNVA
jgi:hypothetical protein